MSTSFGDKLTKRILDYLHFDKEKRDNTVIFLLTGDDDGFPHVALLSPFQVVTSGENEFFLTVYKGTRSQQFLHKNGRGTLILQADPALNYIKFKVREIDGWLSRRGELLYGATPTEVLEDYSDKAPYLSQLKFEPKEIVDDYSAGFQEIREYIMTH